MGLQKEIDKVKSAIVAESTFSREKSNAFDEVFTRFDEVSLMLDRAGDDYWSDPNKTFYDPCAGKGNFPIMVVEKFFQKLYRAIPNEEERLKNIVECQLFMSELQTDSVNFIRDHFHFNLDLKINLFHGNSLEKPADWFQQDWYERDRILRRHPDGYDPNKGIDLLDLFS
jgi:hypothetical protein